MTGESKFRGVIGDYDTVIKFDAYRSGKVADSKVSLIIHFPSEINVIC